MRIYIIRHADPDYPNNTITNHGHKESKALANHLAQEGLTHIYHSPLGRAVHTMEYTQELTGLLPVEMDWLKELAQFQLQNNEHKNTMAYDLPGELLKSGNVLPTHDSWRHRKEFEEINISDTCKLIESSSDKLLSTHGYEKNKNIYDIKNQSKDRLAIFCHGGLGLTWLSYLLSIPLEIMWSSFWLAPTSVTTVLMDERSSKYAVPRAINIGDTSHLLIAGLKPQPRGIKANFD